MLYGHLLLASAAASLTWATGQLLHQRLPPALPWLAGAATLALYNFDGLVPYKRRQLAAATTPRSFWLARHARTLRALALLGAGATLPLAAHLLLYAPDAVRLLLPLGILAGLYSVPVVPWRGRWHPLRDMPLLKGVLIAAVWAGVTVQLPALLGQPAAPAQLPVLLARRILFVLALSLVFDLRDQVKDRAAGTLTVPLLVGERRTRWLAWLLLAGAALLPLPDETGLRRLFVVTPLLGAAAVVAGARPGRSDYYYTVLADGVLLLPALAEWLSGMVR